MTLLTLACRGCHRPIGVAKNPLAAYCTTSCAEMPPATSNEERDSLIEAVARAKKVTPTHLAIHFDMNRQRIHQILRDRHVPAEYER